MSLAWTTLSVIILLLPGFLFISGFYSSIPREAGLRSPLSQLALSILVALLWHGIYFTCFDPYFKESGILPFVRLDYLFALLQLENSNNISLGKLAENIGQYRGYIFSYILILSVFGYGFGKFTAYAIKMNWIEGRGLVSNDWVRDLIKRKDSKTFLQCISKYLPKFTLFAGEKTFVTAHVLTKIEHEGKFVMYSGPVKDFYADSDGTISHLVLSQGKRYYLDFTQGGPEIDESKPKYPLSGTGVTGSAGEDENILWANFVIEGEEIANVLFERKTTKIPSESVSQYETVVNKAISYKKEEIILKANQESYEEKFDSKLNENFIFEWSPHTVSAQVSDDKDAIIFRRKDGVPMDEEIRITYTFTKFTA